MSLQNRSDNNFSHAGKLWRSTPMNFPHDIKIKTEDSWVVGEASLEALIYTLPISYLRPGATTFNEFKMDGKAQAQLKVFSFYMTIVNSIAKANASKDFKMPPGQNSYFLIEYLRSKRDKQAVVGYRFHFYNLRGVKARYIVKRTIEDFAFAAEKRKQKRYLKTDVSGEIHECCRTITTVDQYLLDICDQYLSNNSCSTENDFSWLYVDERAKATESSFEPTRPPKSHPLELFSLRNALNVAKATNEVWEVQCEPTNYYEGLNYNNPSMFSKGYYKFPGEGDLYQVWYNDMVTETMFKKFLPDYYFFNICKVTLETCAEVVINKEEVKALNEIRKKQDDLVQKENQLKLHRTELSAMIQKLNKVRKVLNAYNERHKELSRKEED